MYLLIRIDRIVERKIEVESSDLVIVLVLADQRASVPGPANGGGGGKERREGYVSGPVVRLIIRSRQ